MMGQDHGGIYQRSRMKVLRSFVNRGPSDQTATPQEQASLSSNTKGSLRSLPSTHGTARWRMMQEFVSQSG